MYIQPMDITLDPAKAESNYRDHRIRLSDAEIVLYDPMALTIEDHDIEGETRYATVGSDSIGRTILVVYTHREDEIRIISARRATPTERKRYEEGI